MDFDTTSAWGRWSPSKIAKYMLLMIRSLPVNRCTWRLALLLRKPIKNGRQRIYDVMVWGYRLRLCARGNITEQRWLTVPSFHDAAERKFIAQKLASGGVFFDVGANAGFYTFWVLSLGNNNVRIVSVEPSRTMQERLKYNLTLNGLTATVCLIHAAITHTPSEVTIDECADNLGQTKLTQKGQGYCVSGKTLLQLMDEQNVERIDVLKIDIEGNEADVLEALLTATTRARWPRYIVGEILAEEGVRLCDMLMARGYVLEQTTRLNGMFLLSAETALNDA